MTFLIYLYVLGAVTIFLFLGLVPQAGIQQDKKLGARMMLIAPVWPVALAVVVIYYVWQTAEIGK